CSSWFLSSDLGISGVTQQALDIKRGRGKDAFNGDAGRGVAVFSMWNRRRYGHASTQPAQLAAGPAARCIPIFPSQSRFRRHPLNEPLSEWSEYFGSEAGGRFSPDPNRNPRTPTPGGIKNVIGTADARTMDSGANGAGNAFPARKRRSTG